MELYKNARIVKFSSDSTSKVSYLGTKAKDLDRMVLYAETRFNKWDQLEGEKREKAHKPEFEVMESGEFTVEVVEDYPCENKRQLEERVEELSREDPCSITHKHHNFIPSDEKDLFEEKKTWLRKKCYYEKNRDEINEKYKRASKERILKNAALRGEENVERRGRPSKFSQQEL